MIRIAIAIAAALATSACAGRKPMAEPRLATSPAALYRAIGVTFLRTDQPRRALPYLQRLARVEAGQPEPLYYLGRAFMDLEMWQQARGALDQAIAAEPGYAPAHALLGILLDTRGDHRAAAAAHRRAIALDPGNAGYHNNLGFNRYLAGRYQDALTALDAAALLDPGARRIHNNLGFVYGRLGRLDDAREQFRLAGTDPEADNNLGLVHEARGELDLACEAYQAALRDAPDLTAARANLGRTCPEPAPPQLLDGRQ